jgi:transglutaminase-like putative cysteine protease
LKFEGSHTTSYRYNNPVKLEPHLIRLRPRSDGNQQVNQFSLAIEPSPSGISDYLDLDGNNVTQIWFNEPSDRLQIQTSFFVETRLTNPFDYLISPISLKLPIPYPQNLIGELAPYMEIDMDSSGTEIKRFANEIANQIKWETLPFLSTLAHRISTNWKQIIREEGDPWPSSLTLAKREGSCRDLTRLYLEACRIVGLAGRLVSGYQEGDSEQKIRYLHEWAEIYIPGGGWRGYDPTLGLAVSDRHIALAAGRRHDRVAPITGTFVGIGIETTFQTRISLKTIKETDVN